MPIHPAYRDFLADPRNTVQPPPPHIPMEKVRKAADRAMHQGEFVELPRVEDGEVGQAAHAARYRLYHPAGDSIRPVIFFFHGGGFVWGSVDTHDGICRRLAARTEAAVISIDYRLSPEAPFPAARDDGLSVIRHVLTAAGELGLDPTRFALCGDSAGGQIALSVCSVLVASGMPPKQMSLIYPTVDPGCDSPSQTEFADGPLLTRAAMLWFWDCYLGGKTLSAVTIGEEIMRRFPPMFIVTAENDPLRDEGERLGERLRNLEVPVTTHRAPGLIHGFLSLAACPDAANDAFDLVVQSLSSTSGSKTEY